MRNSPSGFNTPLYLLHIKGIATFSFDLTADFGPVASGTHQSQTAVAPLVLVRGPSRSTRDDE